MSELKIGKIEFGDPLFQRFPNAQTLALEDIDDYLSELSADEVEKLRVILLRNNISTELTEKIIKEFTE